MTNDWALITGASTGIGREMVRLLAARGHNVLLLSRDRRRLQDVADEVIKEHRVQARVVPSNLADPTAAARVAESLSDVRISILINNAGFGAYGPFAAMDLARGTELMQVNMVSLVQLTHHLVQPMLKRRQGYILNVASVAAFLPGPNVNLYYASKAFVFSFSYALAEELRESGVSVTVLCPGTTRTEFFERASFHMSRPWPMMDARTVAQAGLEGMFKGKRIVIPGASNKLMSTIVRAIPPGIPARIVRKVHQPDGKSAGKA